MRCTSSGEPRIPGRGLAARHQSRSGAPGRPAADVEFMSTANTRPGTMSGPGSRCSPSTRSMRLPLRRDLRADAGQDEPMTAATTDLTAHSGGDEPAEDQPIVPEVSITVCRPRTTCASSCAARRPLVKRRSRPTSCSPTAISTADLLVFNERVFQLRPTTRCRCSSGPASPRSTSNLTSFAVRAGSSGASPPASWSARLRPRAARGARADRRGEPRFMDLQSKVFAQQVPALAGGHHDRRLSDLSEDEQSVMASCLEQTFRCLPARGRPGAPVPLYLRAVLNSCC